MFYSLIVIKNFQNFELKTELKVLILLLFIYTDNRKAELESALKEDKGFYQSFDRIQYWLNDMESILAREFLISADQDILKRQVQEFQVSSDFILLFYFILLFSLI